MSTESTNGGIGFLGLLALLFIGLKLTGYITWSWWWVLAPIWLPAVIGCAVLLIGIREIYRRAREDERHD